MACVGDGIGAAITILSGTSLFVAQVDTNSGIVAADGTRVGGLRRAMQMTREATGLSDLTLVASGGPVVLALHAPALKDSPPAVELHHLPPTFRDKSNLMNGVRMIDTDHVLELLGKVTHVTVK